MGSKEYLTRFNQPRIRYNNFSEKGGQPFPYGNDVYSHPICLDGFFFIVCYDHARLDGICLAKRNQCSHFAFASVSIGQGVRSLDGQGFLRNKEVHFDVTVIIVESRQLGILVVFLVQRYGSEVFQQRRLRICQEYAQSLENFFLH